MNTRILALIIIGLCLFSILVGTVNTIVAPKKAKVENAQESSNFFGMPGGNKIALITLQGPISYESSGGVLGDMTSAESVLKSLRRAINDDSVKGVLLRIDSPGGTVAMSQEVYNTILRLRKKKPVVVSMVDLAASGGYYIASAADRIFAEPGTLTGSIGVIINTFNVQELLNQKLGIQANVVKSGKYKDLASPYRPISPDERNLLQNIINSTYQQFVNAIIQGRVKRTDNYDVKKAVLTVDILRKYADGRIFTGEQAQKLGFVDQLGGLHESHEAVTKMAKAKFKGLRDEIPLVQYNVPSGFGGLLFGVSESIMPKKDLTSSLIPLSSKFPHQPLFVWE
ncbi:MAG: hypothetical protein A2104_10480 [Candidatus Melainabacteria bacterium GWF2_32_7]|nr:MAG: hypothetical protein A2104_10480 [Candidatus Melainabacteria bacterium GWF2_32_7]